MISSLLCCFFFKFCFCSPHFAGTIEYTDCDSAERQDPNPTRALNLTLSNLLARLKPRSFGEYGMLLHCNYPPGLL